MVGTPHAKGASESGPGVVEGGSNNEAKSDTTSEPGDRYYLSSIKYQVAGIM